MGIWAETFGIPQRTDFRRRWWHQAAIAIAVLSTLIVFLVVSTIVSRSNIVLTRENTHVLTLLQYARARQGTTTLGDLDSVGGLTIAIASGDRVIFFKRAASPEAIRCKNPAPYASEASFIDHGVTYRAIPDRLEQEPTERRHCAATPAYRSMVADRIGVGEIDSSLVVVQGNKGFFAATAAMTVWLLLYWLMYYRVIIAVYMKRSHARRRLRRAQYLLR
jgi:hypothetical protein